jgi:hypothetical protein
LSKRIYPPDPLSPVLLGGTINLIAGAPGAGKSTFLAWLSRQVRDRLPLWGRNWGQVPWQGIICADRSWYRSTKLWFALEGMQDIPAYSLQDDEGFSKARLRHQHQRIAVFEHCLTQLSPNRDGKFPLGSLIYVDPLSIFLGGNLLDYDKCMVACAEIREMALERGITIIGTAHSSKQRANKQDRYLRLQDRILGSTALFGFTDTQMFIAAPGEVDETVDYYCFLWHPHHAPAQTFRFDRDTQGRFVSGEPLDRPVEAQPEPLAELPEWLAIAMIDPRSFLELIEIAFTVEQWSRAKLNRRLQQLIQQGQVCKPKHGYYQLVKPS